jgi:crotonobetainyl-CoA:carnitine CoA-transferase CaiB-like acyl-CoA transferase
MESPIFQGLKVIDCAATVLSDFGADVIKIEPPHNGDPYRQLPQLPGNPKSSQNYAWLLDSRSKRSLALDLAKPAGQAVLHTLVGQTDVFITNYPREVRRRLKLDYETLAPLNPRLVYASFTGYGEIGEEADKPAFDATAWWARSGQQSPFRPRRKQGAAPPSARHWPAQRRDSARGRL